MPFIRLFLLLNEEAPSVLANLHARPNDRDSVRQWARDYHLEHDEIVHLAVVLKSKWSRNPEWAPIAFFGSTPDVVLETRELEGLAELEWCGEVKATERALPNPRRETLSEWMTRARALYFERQQLAFPVPPPRGATRDESDQHYRLFIRFQVLGQSHKDLADVSSIRQPSKPTTESRARLREELKHRTRTVQLATRKVALLLGLIRRRDVPGRPNKRAKLKP